jgi:hypothetical protein
MVIARARCLVVLSYLLVACDPIQTRALNVAPGPVGRDELQEQALAITLDVARRHGLVPGPPTPFYGEEG